MLTLHHGFALDRQLTVFELTQIRQGYFLVGGEAVALGTDAASLLLLFVQQPERVQQCGVGGLGDLMPLIMV